MRRGGYTPPGPIPTAAARGGYTPREAQKATAAAAWGGNPFKGILKADPGISEWSVCEDVLDTCIVLSPFASVLRLPLLPPMSDVLNIEGGDPCSPIISADPVRGHQACEIRFSL